MASLLLQTQVCLGHITHRITVNTDADTPIPTAPPLTSPDPHTPQPVSPGPHRDSPNCGTSLGMSGTYHLASPVRRPIANCTGNRNPILLDSSSPILQASPPDGQEQDLSETNHESPRIIEIDAQYLTGPGSIGEQIGEITSQYSHEYGSVEIETSDGFSIHKDELNAMLGNLLRIRVLNLTKTQLMSLGLSNDQEPSLPATMLSGSHWSDISQTPPDYGSPSWPQSGLDIPLPGDEDTGAVSETHPPLSLYVGDGYRDGGSGTGVAPGTYLHSAHTGNSHIAPMDDPFYGGSFHQLLDAQRLQRTGMTQTYRH